MDAAETNVLLTLLMLLSWGTSKPMLLVYLLSSMPPAGQPPYLSFPSSFSDTLSHSSSVLTLLFNPWLDPSSACNLCFSSPCDASTSVSKLVATTTLGAGGSRFPKLAVDAAAPSTSVSLSSELTTGGLAARARRAFSSSCSWWTWSSCANQLMAPQRPPQRTERTIKCTLYVAYRSAARTIWSAPNVTFVAISSVGVGPGVKMDSHRSEKKDAMFISRCRWGDGNAGGEFAIGTV